jgi:hypothetical protein
LSSSLPSRTSLTLRLSPCTSPILDRNLVFYGIYHTLYLVCQVRKNINHRWEDVA